ncbi:tripartite tricarboxylate transporter permease [Devosia sp. RR2S18]|jgi:putative tricarboxylic transport membrane protein|uniref:tripartite tricarboxylate transporter permease n=1 Tax=Devosia rhizosphaerae TaxID=3049774 RepID=UPI002540A9C1|nr:tripartite tricarboxylate transporter permease [Devosia sp. RR2S18]WIJ25262.1 tripartite tricarboxylate transporter permease [Devosia sp. RR2S18]HEV7292880.1 tripartite tricarboxylate transporter permease [Devosia sp.]
MEGLILLGQGISQFLNPQSLFNVIWATLLGVTIGILPGLTATMGVALLVTLTYQMQPDQAILTLMCVYLGAIYGGSRTAILLNIPGTPANAAAALDGHPLAQQGKAGLAMGLATTASSLGTLVGIFFLALIAPLLSEAALRFGTWEFFWLAIFGVIISGQMSGSDTPLKGYIAGILGLSVAMIGMETLHAHQRFTFGVSALGGGVDLIPAMVGAFGFAEILSSMKRNSSGVIAAVNDRVVPKLREVFQYWRTIIRSGIIGTFVGIIPGVGEDVGSWTSYAAAKRASKKPEEFGKGSQEGLIAAETGDNAVVSAAMIPTLTLALPGSAAAAVLIAAMYIHGVRPGPMLMVENPSFLYQVVAMLLLATLANLIFGLSLTKLFIQVLRVPRERLMAVIYVLCVVGSFAITQRMFDVYVMLAFGVIGFILREMKYPMAPLVLGIILGDLLDLNLRRGLMLTNGDPSPFFTRPISAVIALVVFTVILMSIPAVNRRVRAIFSRGGADAAAKG